MFRYGSARSNASRGPETAAVIFPARTTFGLPITGAASRAVPRPASSARTRAEASADTVEQSMSTWGAARGLGAQLYQRFGLADGAIENDEVTAGREQPATHLHAHAAGAQPAEPVRVITSSHVARSPPSVPAKTVPAKKIWSQSFAPTRLVPSPYLCQCRLPNLLPKPHQIASWTGHRPAPDGRRRAGCPVPWLLARLRPRRHRVSSARCHRPWGASDNVSGE